MNMKKVIFYAVILVFMNGCFIDVLKQEQKMSLLDDEKQWYVYKIVLQDGREFVPHIDAKSTMIFDVDENRIFGVSACNNYFATFKLSGKKLKLSENGASRHICYPDEMMSYEFHFVRNLAGDFVIHKKGKKMEIKGKSITYYLRLGE